MANFDCDNVRALRFVDRQENGMDRMRMISFHMTQTQQLIVDSALEQGILLRLPQKRIFVSFAARHWRRCLIGPAEI